MGRLEAAGAPPPDFGFGISKPEHVRAAIEAAGLKRQALHAAVLGFVHPLTGAALRFETPPPQDMSRLEALLVEL